MRPAIAFPGCTLGVCIPVLIRYRCWPWHLRWTRPEWASAWQRLAEVLRSLIHSLALKGWRLERLSDWVLALHIPQRSGGSLCGSPRMRSGRRGRGLAIGSADGRRGRLASSSRCVDLSRPFGAMCGRAQTSKHHPRTIREGPCDLRALTLPALNAFGHLARATRRTDVTEKAMTSNPATNDQQLGVIGVASSRQWSGIATAISMPKESSSALVTSSSGGQRAHRISSSASVSRRAMTRGLVSN